jgi:UTP-glucose-1-phosphate uridylyltransferase
MPAISENISKAVIPAAGKGKRLFPITKVLPKEMYPIGNHPAIEWVVAEALASGCKEIAVVISPQKRVIKDYLTTCCPAISESCRMSFLTQSAPL